MKHTQSFLWTFIKVVFLLLIASIEPLAHRLYAKGASKGITCYTHHYFSS
jgi:hypothetical protein